MPIGDEYSSTLTVEVSGSPLSAELAIRLESASVEDSVLVPDSFELRFGDPFGDFFDRSGIAIGTPLSVIAQQSGPTGATPLLHGEVTSVEKEMDITGVKAIVRGFDQSHRLFRNSSFTAYKDKTAGDIVREIAARDGLTAGDIDDDGTVFNHMAQEGVNDFVFLRRLARQTGRILAVKDGKVNFQDPSSAQAAPPANTDAGSNPLVVARGATTLALRATITSSDQIPEVEVRGWSVDNKQELVSVSPAATTSARVDGADPVSLAGTFSSTRRVAAAAGFREQGQFDSAAKALAARHSGGFAEIDATVKGNPRIISGAAITLQGMGSPFDGDYVVSASEHVFEPGIGYTTSFSVSADSDRSLYGITTGALSTSLGDHAPLPSVVTALVTATQDPDQQGRVKISIPSMVDGYESWWARTVQPGAGDQRGWVLLPEVGDEVLVAFEGGDINSPIVIGGMYNGVDNPSPGWSDAISSSDGAIIRRGLTSRTGMVFEMLESPQGESLTIATKDGSQHLTLTQSPSGGIELVADGPISISSTQDITISADQGTLSLSADNIDLSATSNLTLSGMTVSIDADTSAKLSGTEVTVEGQATAELTSSGSTAVRGTIVAIN